MPTTTRQPYSIRQILMWTTVIAVGIAVPDFAFFAPFFLGLHLILLMIVAAVWFIASAVESRPKQLAGAARANFFNLLFVGLAALIYSIYGYWAVGHQWQMG